MKALVALVVAMGVLIVAGVAVVAVTIMHRMGHPANASAATAAVSVLAEPAGTHIGGISAMNDRLAVLLQGGGADRVVFVDSQGQVVGRLSLHPGGAPP
jgi:hypothetical protein